MKKILTVLCLLSAMLFAACGKEPTYLLSSKTTEATYLQSSDMVQGAAMDYHYDSNGNLTESPSQTISILKQTPTDISQK